MRPPRVRLIGLPIMILALFALLSCSSDSDDTAAGSSTTAAPAELPAIVLVHGAFAGPSIGFILGWILATLVVGLVFRAMTGRLRPGISAGRVFTAAFVASVVGAIVVLYACGIPGMALVAGLPLDKAALGSAAFLPGDLVKAVVASLLAAGLWKAYPRAFR